MIFDVGHQGTAEEMHKRWMEIIPETRFILWVIDSNDRERMSSVESHLQMVRISHHLERHKLHSNDHHQHHHFPIRSSNQKNWSMFRSVSLQTSKTFLSRCPSQKSSIAFISTSFRRGNGSSRQLVGPLEMGCMKPSTGFIPSSKLENEKRPNCFFHFAFPLIACSPRCLHHFGMGPSPPGTI